MSKETCTLRPRFKGIENFLKRIAFNLGNSPSQTEVKIISCIPIDVTDLQNKIIELEKELDERTAEVISQQNHAQVVNTVLTGSPLLRPATPASAPAPAPAPADNTPPEDQTPSTSSSSDSSHHPSVINLPNAQAEKDFPASNGYSELKEKNSEGLLQKVKRMGKKKLKNRTHLVYYTQTTNNWPFEDIKEEPESSGRRRVGEEQAEEEEAVMNRAYLEDVVQRQYRPQRLADTSASSHFSSPVCRDEAPSSGDAPLPAPDSDMCSCCHGCFHNLDATACHPSFFLVDPQPPEYLTHRDHSMYYDSNLYDVIPVKERPTKLKDDNMYGYREQCYEPVYDNFTNKFRARPRNDTYIVNYSTMPTPLRPSHKTQYRRKLPLKSVIRREQVLRAMQKRKHERSEIEESSQSCSVDCGQVYEKIVQRKPRTPKYRPPPPPPQVPLPPPPRPVLLKNAECLTMSVNDTECQTATSRSVQLEPPPPEENKTEITLNQIKSILHAVLTEVKTNSQMKNTAEDTLKKDAIVQKGPSQSNMAACSSLINSYTYSPYNTHMNPYGASCSNPSAGGQLGYSAGVSPPAPAPPQTTLGFPAHKCVQNYPLFIHTTGRQCACCYRSIPAPIPRGTITTTNTAHTAHNKSYTAAPNIINTDTLREQRSKQTEKLIKEIYKSLTVNMDYPKGNSHSDYSQNTMQKLEIKVEPKGKKTEKAASEVVRRTEVRGTSPSTPAHTREGSTAASFRSELVSKTTTASGAGSRIRSLLATKELVSTSSDAPTPPTPPTPLQRAPRVARRVFATPPTVSDDDTDHTETPSTDSIDSDATIVGKPEKKKGLFSKMKRLFTSRQKRRRRKIDDDISLADEPASDSDGYETVYSQNTRGDRHGRHVTYYREPPSRRRPHSKVSYSRYHTSRREAIRPRQKPSPYMEQEYRRYWDEKLMFHDENQPRYSSERPFSRESERRGRRVRGTRRGPAYWRDYEAHAALVQELAAPQPPPLRAPRPSPRPQPTATQMIPSTPAEKVILPRVARSAKEVPWYKKLRCGPDWKRIILES